MKQLYVGSFIRRNNKLRAIFQKENEMTTSTLTRIVKKDKINYYVVINKEKNYLINFDINKLEKIEDHNLNKLYECEYLILK